MNSGLYREKNKSEAVSIMPASGESCHNQNSVWEFFLYLPTGNQMCGAKICRYIGFFVDAFFV